MIVYFSNINYLDFIMIFNFLEDISQVENRQFVVSGKNYLIKSC
jgi:hypothetical protein